MFQLVMFRSSSIFLAGFLLILVGGFTASAQQIKSTFHVREQGIEHYTKGETVNAVTLLLAAVESDKKDVLAWYFLGLSYQRLSQIELALSAFDNATKVDPNDYFASLGKLDESEVDARLVEVRSLLVAAANSAILYIELNRAIPRSDLNKWIQRRTRLIDYASLATSAEVTTKARRTTSPFPIFAPASGNQKLTVEMSIVLMFAASGKVRVVLFRGVIPPELKSELLNDIEKIGFVPATKGGETVSQLKVITFSKQGLKGDH
ncbi:MAG: hypothetical protein ABIZ95_04985 [Pyrinomonadaceae bacterium]